MILYILLFLNFLDSYLCCERAALVHTFWHACDSSTDLEIKPKCQIAYAIYKCCCKIGQLQPSDSITGFSHYIEESLGYNSSYPYTTNSEIFLRMVADQSCLEVANYPSLIYNTPPAPGQSLESIGSKPKLTPGPSDAGTKLDQVVPSAVVSPISPSKVPDSKLLLPSNVPDTKIPLSNFPDSRIPPLIPSSELVLPPSDVPTPTIVADSASNSLEQLLQDDDTKSVGIIALVCTIIFIAPTMATAVGLYIKG